MSQGSGGSISSTGNSVGHAGQGGSGSPSPIPSLTTKATIWISILGLVAGVMTVASAYLGLQTAQIFQAKEQAQADAASKGSEISALQDRNNELQTENDELRSQLGGPTAAPLSPAGPSVRHAGQITLAYGGSGVDLDAPSSDPQWGSPASYTDTGDLMYTQNSFLLAFYGEALVLGETKADYDSCRSNTGYAGGTIDVSDVPVGTYICEKTGQKRYSALRLIAIDSSKATFDVVTYDPPYE